MERADLLKDNGKIFVEQGKAIDEVASDDARVVVVGNPCNTNCMIAAAQARRLGPERFTAMTRLDQNRARTQLAQKAGVPVTDVEDIIVFGNHSPTMFADFTNARIGGQARPARSSATTPGWRTSSCPPSASAAPPSSRPAASRSAASAANAAIDHVRSLHTPGEQLHSVAVRSDGSYGFDEGVWASVPVRTTAPGTYEVVREGFEHDDFARAKIAATNAELVEERETVKAMLG